MENTIAATSVKQFCADLTNIPDEVYRAGTDIKTFETVAEKITEYLTQNETFILSAQNADRQEILNCLTELNKKQFYLYQILEACLLANVSIEDYLKALTNFFGFDNKDADKINLVDAALIALGYKSEDEIKEEGISVSEDILKQMLQKRYSKEFADKDAVFHDVSSPNFRYIQKIRFLMNSLEPKNMETGGLSGRACILL